MPRRYGTAVGLILDMLDFDTPIFPLESTYDFLKRKKQKSLQRKRYLETVWRMRRTGYLKVIEKNNTLFLALTKKGALEQLIRKAAVEKTKKWDGKWRLLVYDIPERFHAVRDGFRWLLKKNNFIKLQGSVFVSPYSLNREAISYLTQSGLRQFVKIMKVEEMDDDTYLRKQFGV